MAVEPRPQYRCSYQAEKLFAHLKELAMLIGADGDCTLGGRRWDAFGLPDVRSSSGADLGHSDRLLWIDAQSALCDMEDDPDTVAILRARLELAATNAGGEWTSWRRFADPSAEGRHDSQCLFERYDRGRDRLYGAIHGDVGEAVICNCSL